MNLEIRDADFMAIVGPSGSGKSTLLQIIGLLDQPSRGVIEFDGRDLAALDDGARTRLRLTTLGFVFQRFHLLDDLPSIENVVLPMEILGLPTRERYDRAAWLLKAVGLGERLDFKPSRLSGGQRQRVAMAGPWQTVRGSSWPTSRPASFTPRIRRRSSRSFVNSTARAPPS